MSLADATITITAQPIDSEVFAEYGELLENKSELRRRDFHTQFSPGANSLSLQLWVNRLAQHREAFVIVDALENHPHSAQTFVPMQPGRCLVAVALPDADGKPALSTLRAFVTEGGQGVTYRPAVWHYTFTSLDSPNEVIVIMGQSGQGDDTVIERLAQHVTVVFQEA